MKSFLTFLSEQRSGGGAGNVGAWFGRVTSRDGPSLPFHTLRNLRGLPVYNPIQDTVGPFSAVGGPISRAAGVGSNVVNRTAGVGSNVVNRTSVGNTSAVGRPFSKFGHAANTVRTLGVNQLTKKIPNKFVRTAINNSPAFGAGFYALGQENETVKRILKDADTGVDPAAAGLTNANILGAAYRTAQQLNPRELANVSTSKQVRGKTGTALINVINRAAAGNINALTTAASEISGKKVHTPRIPGSDTVSNRINQLLGRARNTPMQDYDVETAGVVIGAELAKGADVQASDKEGLDRFIGNYLKKRRRLVGPDVVTTRRGRIVNPGQMADSGGSIDTRKLDNLQLLAKSMNDE